MLVSVCVTGSVRPLGTLMQVLRSVDDQYICLVGETGDRISIRKDHVKEI